LQRHRVEAVDQHAIAAIAQPVARRVERADVGKDVDLLQFNNDAPRAFRDHLVEGLEFARHHRLDVEVDADVVGHPGEILARQRDQDALVDGFGQMLEHPNIGQQIVFGRGLLLQFGDRYEFLHEENFFGALGSDDDRGLFAHDVCDAETLQRLIDLGEIEGIERLTREAGVGALSGGGIFAALGPCAPGGEFEAAHHLDEGFEVGLKIVPAGEFGPVGQAAFGSQGIGAEQLADFQHHRVYVFDFGIAAHQHQIAVAHDVELGIDGMQQGVEGPAGDPDMVRLPILGLELR